MIDNNTLRLLTNSTEKNWELKGKQAASERLTHDAAEKIQEILGKNNINTNLVTSGDVNNTTDPIWRVFIVEDSESLLRKISNLSQQVIQMETNYKLAFDNNDPEAISHLITKSGKDADQFALAAFDTLKELEFSQDEELVNLVYKKLIYIIGAKISLEEQGVDIGLIPQDTLAEVTAKLKRELTIPIMNCKSKFSDKSEEFRIKPMNEMSKKAVKSHGLSSEARKQEEAARSFLESIRDRSAIEPRLLTQAHELYEKVAKKHLELGNVEEAYRIRGIIANEINMSPSHPLHHMDKAIADKMAKMPDPQFGAHFGDLGSGTVKGGNLRAVTRNIDGKTMNCFEFKMSHHAREELGAYLENFQYRNSPNKEAWIKSLPEELQNVRITTGNYTFLLNDKDKKGEFSEKNPSQLYTPNISYQGPVPTIEIIFPEIGKVIVGGSPQMGCLYNNVTVMMEAGKSEGEGLKYLHQMLTVLGCGPVTGVRSEEDDQRLKIAQLFRAYFPSQAMTIERTNEFYEMAVDDLKKKIETLVPEMKDIFKKYLVDNPELMRKGEIYPGKTVWCIEDLHTQMKTQGAWGLYTGMAQNAPNFESTCLSLKNILKYGALSSQDRFQAGIGKAGVSSLQDLASGGGDQVFARLITEQLASDLGEVQYSGTMQVLYDLSAVNRVSYGFSSDYYGVKNSQSEEFYMYQERHNLINLVNRCRSNNEIMVKNHISTDYIVGVRVKNEEEKMQLIQFLGREGFLKEVEGQQFVLLQREGFLKDEPESTRLVPLNKFIHVNAATYTEEMYSNATEH